MVIALFGVGAAAVFSGHYQLRPVLSSSMEPMLPVGGVVVTERIPMSTVRAGDVVVFHRPDQPKELMVHRIIALTPGPSGPVVQTRGDANRVADPWKVSLRGPTAYRVLFAVPLVGYVAVWVHSPAGRDTLILVGLLLVAGAGAGALIHLRRSARGGTAGTDQPGPDAGRTSSGDLDADPPAEADLAPSARQ